MNYKNQKQGSNKSDPCSPKELIRYSFLSMFIFAIFSNLLGPSLELIDTEFNIGLQKIGFLITFNFIGYLISVLVVGYLSDIKNKKKILVAGLVIASAGLFATTLVREYYFLYATLALIGAGGGTIECVGSSLISDITNDDSKYLNLSQGFYCLGALLAPLLVYLLHLFKLSWRLSYVTISFSILPLILALLKQKYFEKNKIIKSNIEGFYSIKAAFRNRNNFLLILAMFFYVGCESSIVNWLNSYLLRSYDSSYLVSNLSLSAFWITMGIGRFLSGNLGHKINSHHKIIVASLVCGILLFSLNIVDDIYISIAIICLVSLIISGIFSDILVCAKKSNKAFVGTAFGIIIFFAGAGGMVFPAFLGVLAGKIGIQRAFNNLTAFLMVACFVSMLRYKE